LNCNLRGYILRRARRLPAAMRRNTRDVPRPGNINAGHVEERLADAGRVLLALPWSGCFPAGFRSLWPDQGGPSAQRCVPTSQEITAMDEAYGQAPSAIMRDIFGSTSALLTVEFTTAQQSALTAPGQFQDSF